MEKKQYRNAQKTRAKIKQSFLILNAQKHISKIRIHEITDLADISKGAFYTHYQDIYAIIEEIESETIAKLKKCLVRESTKPQINDFSTCIGDLTRAIDENKEIYVNLFSSDSSYQFLDQLQEVFVQYMMSCDELINQLESKESAEIFFRFIAVGTASHIHRYFLNPNNQNLPELVDTLNKCILHGITAFVEEK